ncbi:MAG: ABC transporter ATP-binding protein [Lachnospiraceae bacterium]|nr:ABC transporter ATP-binding protein [Lachnospiraceae bacterium]
MSLLEISVQDVISFACWLVASYGLSKIFKKFHIEGWWAFIPGARIYWLGRCADREDDGKIAMIFELLTFPVMLAMQLLNENLEVMKYILLLNIFLGIVCMIYKARICIDLCGDLKVNKNWAWLWVFAEVIPCLVWGFSDKYTPSKALLRYNGLDPVLDDELIHSLEDTSASDNGLSVKIKDRTVRNFLDKRYLLREIFMTIDPGHMVLLLGGSGAGKTTFINAVTGYEKANAEILLDGMNVYDEYDKMKYSIGFVPQLDLIRSNDTVYRTLYDAALLRLPSDTTLSDLTKRVKEVLEQFGLATVKASLVEKLSGGQRKRLSIAMEYISDPYLFVLDEPDSGLDGVIARDLMRRLRTIANEGKIVIVITHTPDRVADLFDDIIVLAKDSKRTGRLAFYGSIDEAREFFGQNTMEGILRVINQKDEGGEGRSDEFVLKYAERQVVSK